MEERKENVVTAEDIIKTSARLLDIEPGVWLESKNFDDGFWTCSMCGFVSEATAAPILYKYCPNCGHPMKGEC